VSVKVPIVVSPDAEMGLNCTQIDRMRGSIFATKRLFSQISRKWAPEASRLAFETASTSLPASIHCESSI
jgi:hypothetical protein